MERRYLSIAEAGQVLGLSRTSLYRLQKAGLLPAVRMGSRVLIPIAALERLEATAFETVPESK